MGALSTGGLLSQMAPTLFGRACYRILCRAFLASGKMGSGQYLQLYVVKFEGEGGADQSVDQLVDLAHSLRRPAGQSGRGGAEQLAMHCQWGCDDNKNEDKNNNKTDNRMTTFKMTRDDYKNENGMTLKSQLPLHPKVYQDRTSHNAIFKTACSVLYYSKTKVWKHCVVD